MQRPWILGIAGVCVFFIVTLIMLQLMPPPLKPLEYLVIGSVATLMTLLVLFGVTAATAPGRNVLYKKRRK